MTNNKFVFLIAGVLLVAISPVSSYSPDDSLVATNNNTDSSRTEQNCECYNDDCGCCEYIVWRSVGINGTVCSNFSYLPNDYGVSVTITWNSYTIFNETISVRNPPPICFGIPKMEDIKADLCLRLYNLAFEEKRFHGCGKISISVYHLIHKSFDLGCFDIPKEALGHAYATGSHRILRIIGEQLKKLEFWRKDAPTVNMI